VRIDRLDDGIILRRQTTERSFLFEQAGLRYAASLEPDNDHLETEERMTFRGRVAAVIALSMPIPGVSAGAQTVSLEVCKAEVRRAAESQKAKGQALASVDIDPSKTSLKQLRAILGEDGMVSSNASVRNRRTIYWLLGPLGSVEYATEHCKDWGPTPSKSLFSSAVQADFLSSTDAVDENARPISIEINAPFAGSIRGLKVTDPESRIIELGTRAGFRPSAGPPNSVKLDGNWEVRWNLDRDPQKRQYIEIRALGYALMPR
jgi:hypothetical protein